jgi:hypothetical protein
MKITAVLLLLLGAILPPFALAQAAPAPQALDERVRQFLDAQKDQWREENITASDGRFLYDLIVKKGYSASSSSGLRPDIRASGKPGP